MRPLGDPIRQAFRPRPGSTPSTSAPHPDHQRWTSRTSMTTPAPTLPMPTPPTVHCPVHPVPAPHASARSPGTHPPRGLARRRLAWRTTCTHDRAPGRHPREHATTVPTPGTPVDQRRTPRRSGRRSRTSMRPYPRAPPRWATARATPNSEVSAPPLHRRVRTAPMPYRPATAPRPPDRLGSAPAPPHDPPQLPTVCRVLPTGRSTRRRSSRLKRGPPRHRNQQSHDGVSRQAPHQH